MAKGIFVVTTTPLRTKLSDALIEDCNYILGQQNVKQVWTDERDSNGERLPEGIDLFESGTLKDSMDSDTDGYRFDASYAEYVDRRVPFAGLSDASLEEATAALQQRFEEEGDALIAEEE